MEFYLSDILDLVVEYIHRHRLKSKLINSFYLPIISFININKKYYRFDFCKKHIGSQCHFSVKSNIQCIVNDYIIALKNNNSLALSVSFESETFLEILELLISLCNNIINRLKCETNEEETYHNELELWVKSDCFSFIQNKNPQTN